MQKKQATHNYNQRESLNFGERTQTFEKLGKQVILSFLKQ